MRRSAFSLSILAAFGLTLMVLLGTAFSACSSSTAATPSEFIADSSTFSSYSSWTLTKTTMGPDPLLAAMAHGGNDSTVTRQVYIKNAQSASGGSYPIGTLVCKNTHNPSGTANMITAMAKRGNGFNPLYGDWEFFILDSGGKIMKDSSGMQMRGAHLMNDMCGGCHHQATTDYVFSK